MAVEGRVGRLAGNTTTTVFAEIGGSAYPGVRAGRGVRLHGAALGPEGNRRLDMYTGPPVERRRHPRGPARRGQGVIRGRRRHHAESRRVAVERCPRGVPRHAAVPPRRGARRHTGVRRPLHLPAERGRRRLMRPCPPSGLRWASDACTGLDAPRRGRCSPRPPIPCSGVGAVSAPPMHAKVPISPSGRGLAHRVHQAPGP